MKKTVKIGDTVIYTDPVGQDHNALVTYVWPKGPNGELGNTQWEYDTSVKDSACLVNLVYVSDDDHRSDGYGRQLQRNTSVNHMWAYPIHGPFWREHGTEKDAVNLPK